MYCSPFYPVSLKIDEKAGDRPPMRFQNRSIVKQEHVILARAGIGGQRPKQ